jgi:tape measure domain-containing protein
MQTDNGRLNFSAGIDTSQLRRDANESRSILHSIGQSAKQEGEEIDRAFKNIGKTIAGAFAVQQLMSFASSVVKVRGEIQALEIAFNTMIGNKKEADALMSQLIKTAATTPFGMSDIANAAKQLLAYGVETEKINDTLIRLGDIAAGLSIPIGDLAYLYGTTMVQGRMYTQDLNQFLGRGIPIAEELADIFGVTESKVRDLVTEGKVGFPEVEQAIINLTNEGSKFGGLMKEQSAGIAGRISNIKDNIEQMFDKIGESTEGIIETSLDIVSSLVENWETVGKILLTVIATYGTYKAAVLAVAAAHKISAIWGNVSAFLSLTKSVKGAKDAMLLFNMAVKANPLGLVLSVVAAAATAFSMFRTETEKAAEAQAELKKNIEDEVKKLDDLYKSIHKAKQGSEERNKAIGQFNSDYGQYLSNLLSEQSTVEDISNAYIEAKKSLIDFQIAKSKDSFLKEPIEDLADSTKKFYAQLGDWTKELNTPEQQARFTAYVDQILNDVKNGGYFSIEKIYDAFRAAQAKNNYANVDAWKEAFRAGNETFGESNIDIINRVGGWDVNDVDFLGKSIQRLQGVLTNAESDFKKFSSTYTDIVSPKTSGGEATKFKSFSEQVEEARLLVSTLNGELNALRAGQGNDIPDFAQAIEDKEKQLKDAQNKLNTLLGIDPKKVKADSNDAAKAFSEYEKIILAANEQLASEEIQLQRNKIEDKIALIEFDRQQTIAAIEKTRAEALKAWTDSGRDAVNFDGSIFQHLIDAANLQAAFDTDNAISEQTKKQQEELDALLQQFRTYEQQRADIVEEYNGKITQLREAGENEAAEVAEKRRDEALTALAQSMMEESDLWVRLFEDASKKSVSQIEDIISETESLLDYLKGKDGAEIPLGFTDEQLKSLKGSPEVIKKIQDAIKRLKGEIGSKSPFKQFANDINDAIDQIKSGGKDNIGAGIMNIGNAVNTIAPHVKQFGDDLSNIFGDSSIAENIGILTDTLAGIGTAAAGVVQIITGDNILGGITSVVSGISSIFSMARQAAERHREALAAVMNSQIAQQREYNLLLLEQNLLYEKGTTIFGSDEYGKVKQYIKVYKQALADLNEAMAGTDAQKRAQSKRYNLLSLFGIKGAQSTLKQIYAGLADIEIVTGHKKTGLFGWGKGKDLYSSVLSVYPDLIKANGEFNKELAQSIINTRKMSDEDKNALQNMIDLYEQYEEAMQDVRDYLSGIFGELGNTMSDALVDAFKNGSDAAEAFSNSVSEMLEVLAQQMIYSVTLAPIMEKAHEQMLEVMKNGNFSDDEKFARYAGILSNLTDEALSQQENANYLMKLYQDMAAAKGIDIFQPDDTGREATSKGIASASQESVDELNGRATAIQSHTYSINENTKLLVANSSAILECVIGIEQNTQRIADRMDVVEISVRDIRNDLADITIKGVKIN